MPNPGGGSGLLEFPAGLLDDDPEVKPDKHIFVELKSPWFEIKDCLPQCDWPALTKLRALTSDK